MDFFRSVFSDEPDPPNQKAEIKPESSGMNQQQEQEEENPDPNISSNPNTETDAGIWSFGGLIKTLSTKSETVLETYRRDLKEFGSGLKKELEVAQGSLGTMSSVIDEFGNTVIKGTAEIISQGKDAILAADNESESSDNINSNIYNSNGQQKRYNRFEAQLRAIQGDVNTYCEEVDDLDDYKKWKSGLVLDNMSEEIESLFEQNGAMEIIYKKVVPNSVDHETFWFRYFYRVLKLKHAEEMRVILVKRAISREEDEDLSWDVDDDDDDEEDEDKNENKNKMVAIKTSSKEIEDKISKDFAKKSPSEEVNAMEKSDSSKNKELGDKGSEKVEMKDESSKPNIEEVSKESVPEGKSESVGGEKSGGKNKEDLGVKADEKVGLTGKAESGESGKDSDISVVSSQPSGHEEEDLGWDEIEDLSSIEEKKATQSGGSPNRTELRKRLSAAEEEEDLSWDIEDDDEPVKA